MGDVGAGTVDISSLIEFVGRLHESRDAELVLLRGHVTVERVLVLAVAARLWIETTEKMPRISFPALARLASEDETEERVQLAERSPELHRS